MKENNGFKALALLVSLLILNSCRGDYCTEAPIAEDLYKRALAPKTSNNTGGEGLHCFIDYSSGIFKAVNQNKESVDDFLQMIDDAQTKYYRVGYGAPQEIEDIKATENYPYNPSNYNENRSRLLEAIKLMAEKKQQSVFLTDFELIDTGRKDYEAKKESGGLMKTMLNPNPWAIAPFRDWLKKGGKVDIFAMPFEGENYATKTAQAQHLYLIFMSPTADPKSYASQFKKLAGNKVKHFDFSTLENLSLKKDEFTLEDGGLHEYMRGYGLDYQKFDDNADYYVLNYQDVEGIITTDPSLQDKRLLHYMYLPDELPTGFSDLQAGLRAYDLTNSYNSFLDFVSAEAPEYDVDPETGDSTLISGDPNASFSFDKGSEIPGLFELTQNKTNGELGIKLTDRFTLESKCRFMMLELYLEDSKFSMPSESTRKLSWTDARGFKVSSLAESLEEAVRDAQKESKAPVLHRFFITFTQ